MAASKTSSLLVTTQTIAAGATLTSSIQTLTTTYGALILGTVSNGGTAPTAGTMLKVLASPDGTNWATLGQAQGGITANTSYSFMFDVHPAVSYVETQFIGATGQTTTISAQLQILASV